VSPSRASRSSSGAASGSRAASGQAAVELVAVLPVVAVLAAFAWQAIVAAHAAWSAAAAARAAARAAAVGEDAEAVARRRLGPALGAGASVRDAGDGRVVVSVAIPRVMAGVPVGRVDGEASFRPQDGGP
jgi:hypothetical protein